LSKAPLLVAALLAFATLPLVGVASACINNCRPIVYACASGVTGSCGDGDDVCFAFASSPVDCIEGPGDIISCGGPIGVHTWAVGVTYHGCAAVDGYVCTDPRYFGGGGGGPLNNFVCEGYATFSLP
jgi:hypothetical protein